MQNPAAYASRPPRFFRQILVSFQQKVEKPGILKQRLVQETPPSVFSKTRKENAPRCRRQVGREGRLEKQHDAPTARMMMSLDI
jgi:hypothetical protein